MREVVVTTVAIRHAKLQSKRHQLSNTQYFLQVGCSSYCPTNSVKALKGRQSRIKWKRKIKGATGESRFNWNNGC